MAAGGPWTPCCRPGPLTANVLAQSLVAAAVLVAWHRVVLLGETPCPASSPCTPASARRVPLTWLMLSLLFMLVLVVSWIVALGFVAMLGARPCSSPRARRRPWAKRPSSSSWPEPIGALLIATYATTRLSLILPAWRPTGGAPSAAPGA